MIRVVRFLGLVAIWIGLWSDLTIANLASGALVAAAIVVVFDHEHHGTLVFRPIHAVRFGLYFAAKLVESTVVVARVILSPRAAVHTGIVAIPLRGCSDALVVVIANAISLTPGTLTLEIRRDPLVVYVHALDLRDVEQVRQDVRRLEVLAIRAFGSAAAIDGLSVDDTESWSAG